jgi:uncharacterized SAM-binding protein YcdF (DUF218 family)
MVAGADLVRYFFSAGGVVCCFLIASLWLALSGSSRHARRFAILIAIVFLVASLYGPQSLLARAMTRPLRPFTAADAVQGRRTAIVLLGSGSVVVEDWSGRSYSFVDYSAAARALEAARVYGMIDPAIVISSGGNPHPEERERPSGETMRNALIALGVPADRIVTETASKTTRDEAVIVAGLLRDQHIEQTVLVTSQTHMRRAVGAFRAAGVHPIPAIAQEFERDISLSQLFLPTDDGLWVAGNTVHEILGLTYYWMRGWWVAA